MQLQEANAKIQVTSLCQFARRVSRCTSVTLAAEGKTAKKQQGKADRLWSAAARLYYAEFVGLMPM
jgi:hypothetical protein